MPNEDTPIDWPAGDPPHEPDDEELMQAAWERDIPKMTVSEIDECFKIGELRPDESPPGRFEVVIGLRHIGSFFFREDAERFRTYEIIRRRTGIDMPELLNKYCVLVDLLESIVDDRGDDWKLKGKSPDDT